MYRFLSVLSFYRFYKCLVIVWSCMLFYAYFCLPDLFCYFIPCKLFAFWSLSECIAFDVSCVFILFVLCLFCLRSRKSDPVCVMLSPNDTPKKSAIAVILRFLVKNVLKKKQIHEKISKCHYNCIQNTIVTFKMRCIACFPPSE